MEYAVGKTAQQYAPYLAVDRGVGSGIPLDGGECGVHGSHELLAETRRLLFVPSVCFFDVGLCLWPDLQAVAQRGPSRRARASSQGMLAPGSAS